MGTWVSHLASLSLDERRARGTDKKNVCVNHLAGCERPTGMQGSPRKSSVTVLTLSPSGPRLCPEEAQGQPRVTPHSHPCRGNLPLSPGLGSCTPVRQLRATPHSQGGSEQLRGTVSPEWPQLPWAGPEHSTFKYHRTGPFPSTLDKRWRGPRFTDTQRG